MPKHLSNWINLGFLQGLVIVTAITLPDLPTPNNDDEAIETPVLTNSNSQTDDASHSAEMPSLLKMASLPRPSLALRQQTEMATTGNRAILIVKDQNRSDMGAESQPETKHDPQSETANILSLIEPLSPQQDGVGKKNDIRLQTQLVAVTPPTGLARPFVAPLTTMNVRVSRPNIPISTITPMPPKFDAPTPGDLSHDQRHAMVAAKVRPEESTPRLAIITNAELKTAKQVSVNTVANPNAADLAKAQRQINDRNAVPSLEFLWPANSTSHQQIYHALTHCLGMVVGQINDLGDVVLAPGQGVTRLNKNLHSPLLRSLETPVTNDEARAVASLDNASRNKKLIRIFRKDMDIRLLAGLRKLTGTVDHLTGRVTAEYLLTNDGLYLDKVTHNGALLSGRIQLHKGRCA